MQIDRPVVQLSPREQQLIQYAAEGMTDTAISHKLGISEATVGTYWGRVRIKLGPYSRTELVAIIMRAEREAAVEELRRENEHLVEELKAVGNDGRIGYYRDLLESAPDAMVLVSDAGMIEYVNLAGEELFGYDREELHGTDLSILIPLHLREQHILHRAEYISNPQRRQMGGHLETPALRKDGSEFRIRAALSAINTPSGLIVMCAIRPSESP